MASLEGHVQYVQLHVGGMHHHLNIDSTTSHFSALYTVMIHFLQFMNFGCGVTFYKGQAKVKSGYHPTCTFCKIDFYHLKAEQILKHICTFKLANSVIMAHHSNLRGAIIELRVLDS